MMLMKNNSAYFPVRRRAQFLLLFTITVLTVSWTVLVPCYVAATSPSESSSWWDGMKFDDSQHDNVTRTSSSSSSSTTTTTTSHSEGPIRHDSDPILLQVPCGIMIGSDNINDNDNSDDVLPLTTIIDTSLATSTIQSSALQTYPQLQTLLVRHEETETTTTTRTGRFVIPAGTLQLRMGSVEATVPAPALEVIMETSRHTHDSWQLRLGLDFLRQYQAMVDIGNESLQLTLPSHNSEKIIPMVTVPFLRPRASLNFGDSDGDEL
ncbi:hypothetical protein IV203_005142 [Nitzschia inconspicua]|uniref:Uncharacterized protein n=1 Tax=Nitzschia inconspicua TaxID=303405 RepID=A0A9K3KN03_9STRA|nr:hypothetical protein IV203_005142 [Nitzschia inconspicua]